MTYLEKKYTAISLFSGCGGDSLGLKQAGCSVIAYNEINKVFCKTHDSNFPESKLICSIDEKKTNITDITKLEDSCFSEYSGKIDILFAGFPCQGFSTAGKKKEDDPRNSLFLQFLRATKLINPHMIIGENVKGLLTRKNYINIIVREFEKLDYEVNYKVLKCEQHGIPQKRERLIILGIKKNNPYQWKLQFPLPITEISVNLKDIITYDMSGAVQVPSEWFKDVPDECILNSLESLESSESNEKDISKDLPHPYLLRKINADETNRIYNDISYENLFSFGKRISPIHCEIIDIRNPCKTIICTYEHQPRLFVPLKNPNGYYLRMLLPDELKQIQGFPKDYIIHGSIKEKIIQIGNAVPPPLIREIVTNIISNTRI